MYSTLSPSLPNPDVVLFGLLSGTEVVSEEDGEPRAGQGADEHSEE